MAVRNPDFAFRGDADPFIRTYRRIFADTNGHILEYANADFGGELLNKTRKRISGVARLYFPGEHLANRKPNKQGIALRDGLTVGFMVGRKVVPLIARHAYYRYTLSHMIPEASVFDGYHLDVQSIQNEVTSEYGGIASEIEVPERDDMDQTEAFIAGVGYMATHCAQFCGDLTWPYIRDALRRDAHRKSTEKTVHFLASHNTVLHADDFAIEEK